MRFEEVEGLRRDVAARIAPIISAVQAQVQHWEARSDDPVSVALGVGLGLGSDDYTLAVRYQHRLFEETALEALVMDLARGEASVFYIGKASSSKTAAQQQFQNPIYPGISIGVLANAYTLGTTGTIAAICELANGSRVALSCNHVLTPGNVLEQKVNQPGKLDIGSYAPRSIGTGLKTVELLPPPGTNEVDCAITSLTKTPNFVDPAIGAYAAPAPVPTVKTDVRMSGRTTKATGTVTAIRLKPVQIDGYDFVDQIEVTGTGPKSYFATGGDSGAMVVNSANEPIGIAIGEFPSGSVKVTMVSAIGTVMTKLGITRIL